jgi:hypothetical protein
MSDIQFANNAHSTLASGISDSATSITVASGHGARFPTLTGSQFFFATLIDTSNNLEIVKCTARSSDVLTVTRAQESTSAQAFSSGDRIELRITAAGLAAVTADATTSTKGIASFASADFSVSSGAVTLEAAVVKTDEQNTFTKAQLPSTYTGTGLTLDFDTYQNFIITLSSGSNTLAAPTTEASQIGQTGVIIFIQPSSSSAGTVSLHGDYETPAAAGLTLSSTNSAYDVVPYIVKADNSILLGSPQLAFG